jgi:hypothetical protein
MKRENAARGGARRSLNHSTSKNDPILSRRSANKLDAANDRKFLGGTNQDQNSASCEVARLTPSSLSIVPWALLLPSTPPSTCALLLQVRRVPWSLHFHCRRSLVGFLRILQPT